MRAAPRRRSSKSCRTATPSPSRTATARRSARRSSARNVSARTGVPPSARRLRRDDPGGDRVHPAAGARRGDGRRRAGDVGRDDPLAGGRGGGRPGHERSEQAGRPVHVAARGGRAARRRGVANRRGRGARLATRRPVAAAARDRRGARHLRPDPPRHARHRARRRWHPGRARERQAPRHRSGHRQGSRLGAPRDVPAGRPADHLDRHRSHLPRLQDTAPARTRPRHGRRSCAATTRTATSRRGTWAPRSRRR